MLRPWLWLSAPAFTPSAHAPSETFLVTNRLRKLSLRRLRGWARDLRTSFWFVPLLIVLAAVGLAVGLIAVESLLPPDALDRWPLLFGAAADGSRALLAAVAGSMITVAGTVFSITIVALTLASSQYTPRVLQGFMRDRVNQTVLGVFVGIFAYCLVVLRTVRGGDDDPFVPSLAVLFALVLAIVGLVFLIIFIHHTATSIQASHIIAAVRRETLHAIDRLFPDADRPDDADDGVPSASSNGAAAAHPELDPDGRTWHAFLAPHSGYIQEVDIPGLIKVAKERHAVIRMERSVGEFVIKGTPVASVLSLAPLDEDFSRILIAMYSVGDRRTQEQDVGFGIRQIVDVALRALSPGINDTTTATMCLDRLTEILVCLAERNIRCRHRDDEGQIRLLTDAPSFGIFVDESLNQIRRNAEGNLVVLEHMLRDLDAVTGRTASEPRRSVLLRHARAVQEVARRSIPAPEECQTLDASCRRLIALLTEPPR